MALSAFFLTSCDEGADITALALEVSPPAPPSAPTGLVAVGTDQTVSLSWSPSAGATSYNVYWSGASGVTTASAVVPSAISPFAHAGRTNNAVYYYRVTALNGFGESALSAEVSATPVSCPPGTVCIGNAGQTVLLTGSLGAGDPQWDRPSAACGTDFNPGSRYFDQYHLRNNTAGPQTVDVEGVWNLGDGYLHAYTPPFNPASPLTNCTQGNDDDWFTFYSRLEGIVLQPGQELDLIASTYGILATAGPYSIDVVSRTVSPHFAKIQTWESGTLEGWGATGLWHVSSLNSADGGFSAHYANTPPLPNTYDTGVANSGALTSQSFQVAGDGWIAFYYYLDNECQPANGYIDFSPCGFDRLTVEVAAGGGAFVELLELPHTQFSWLYQKVDLGAYLGQTVQVRFNFNTGDAGLNAHVGAYVDAVLIY